VVTPARGIAKVDGQQQLGQDQGGEVVNFRSENEGDHSWLNAVAGGKITLR